MSLQYIRSQTEPLKKNDYVPRGILNLDVSEQTVTGIRLGHIRHVREWKIKLATLELRLWEGKRISFWQLSNKPIFYQILIFHSNPSEIVPREWALNSKVPHVEGCWKVLSPTRKETSYSDRRFWVSYILFTIIIGGILVLFTCITRLASNEIF